MPVQGSPLTFFFKKSFQHTNERTFMKNLFLVKHTIKLDRDPRNLDQQLPHLVALANFILLNNVAVYGVIPCSPLFNKPWLWAPPAVPGAPRGAAVQAAAAAAEPSERERP